MRRLLSVHVLAPSFLAISLSLSGCVDTLLPTQPLSPGGGQSRIIPYRLSKPGRVSLAIYDAQGRQVRTLLDSEPQGSGKQSVVWDGLDRNGQPVAVGTYTWKLLETQGLTAEFALNIGTPGRDHWPANHMGPTATLVLGDTLLMTAGNTEATVNTVKMNLADGRILESWGNNDGWNPVTDLAFDDTPSPDPLFTFAEHGRLYMPVPQCGKMSVWALDGGRGLNPTGAYWTKYTNEPSFYAPIKRLALTDGAASVGEGCLAVPPEKYSPARGCGWEDAEGVRGFADKGVTGHLVLPAGGKDTKIRTFLVDVPIGGWTPYHVTFHFGHPTQGFNKFTLYGGTSYDQPRGLAVIEELKAGEDRSVSYDVLPLPGTQLRLAFGPAPGAEFTGCPIRAIEVSVGGARVDACKGKLVLGYPLADTVQQLTPGGHSVIRSWRVPDFRDVAILADGSVVALSSNRLVLLEQDGPTLIGDLTEPRLVSVDRSNGDLFVVEAGDSQRIKRFGADYRLKASYGRKGGRRQGLYQAQDFLAVSSLSPDGKGGFVITEAESAPRRTAHFDRDGKLIKEWYGGQLWATFAAPDPRDDRRVWISSHWGWLMEAEVDWAEKSWRPRACYRIGDLAKGLVQQNSGFEVRYWNGEKYLAITGVPQLFRVDEGKGALVPVMTSNLNMTHYWSAQSKFMQELIGDRQSKKYSYVWNDRNGDGEPQADEVMFSTWSQWGPGWSCDDKLNFYGISSLDTTKKEPGYELTMITPDSPGAPRPAYAGYDARVKRVFPADASLRNVNGILNPPADLRHGADGATYVITKGPGDGFTGSGTGVPGHHTMWPANETSASAFAKWDKDGNLLWVVGSKAGSEQQLRAKLHDPIKIAGEVNGCVGVADRIVLPVEIWTTDGLYVGGLFDHRAADGLPASYYAWFLANRKLWPPQWENQAQLKYDMYTGGKLMQRKNGDVYFLGSGDNNVPTYRITGWDQFVRKQGTVKITQAGVVPPQAGTGLKGVYYRGVTREVLVSQVEPLWLGDAGHNKPWPKGLPEAGTNSPRFAAEWKGALQPRFSEAYVLRLYVGQDKEALPEPAKVTLAGKVIMDTTKAPEKNVSRFRSPPVLLEAGTRVPITVTYTNTSAAGEMHLCWESVSQPIEHIPAVCLYTD